MTKTEDILTRGRAAQQEGLTEDARTAFKRAIAVDPSNMEAVLTYVYFLYSQTPVDYAEMIARLEDARLEFSPKISDDVRRRITHELVNAYFYMDAPFGFQAAIDVGNRYVVGLGAKDADAYVYLAAAHGQGYTYFKTRDPSVAKSELMLVIDSARNALASGDAQTKDWLRYLATRGGDDEDLIDAATDSAELRTLLNSSNGE